MSPTEEQMEAAMPLHTEFFDASQGMRSISAELSALASAFSATGNDRVAEQLWTCAGDLDHLSDKVRAATARMVDERLHESRQATSNMIGLAFALLEPRAKAAGIKPQE